MKAVVLEGTCKAEDLIVRDIDVPEIKEEYVLVKVCAFGINRSEVILRDYEADEDYINLPVVPGIECAGKVIESCSDNLKKGDVAVALMGGMGRSFNGSYEEYALLPARNVFKIDDKILDAFSTEEIAAIPETFFTAYSSLFECLQLSSEDILLIRGATSSIGQSAICLAKAGGCKVIATTRNEKKFNKLLSQGADYVVTDDGNIENKIKELYPEGVTKVLELVGPATYHDSMNCLCINGFCCVTGILGNKEYIDKFDPIKDIPNGKYVTSFFSNYPNEAVINDIFDYLINNDIKPSISRVFNSLEDISDAHLLMESNTADGKIVVKLDELVGV